MPKFKHQCHCACSSEIGTCIINDAVRQSAHNKQRKSGTDPGGGTPGALPP